MLKNILMAGAGGFAGSALRYAVSLAMTPLMIKSGLPAGTLLVNAIGSLLIGIFFSCLPHNGWYMLLGVGFCGGFTTFSAFSLESLRMLKAGQYGVAAAYILASVAVCLLFAWLGMLAGSKFKAG